MRPLTLAAAGLAALLCLAADATAHDRSVSYSTWSLTDQGARVRARVSRLDLTRLALDPVGSRADSETAGRSLAESLRLYAGDAACPPAADPVRLSAEPGWLVYAWDVACPGAGARRIATSWLLGVAPSHLHFARVERAGGSALRVLTAAEPGWELADATAGAGGDGDVGTGLLDFVGLGVEHILSGWDHLAFVIALLLLAATLREVAALVTGFTVAHSITLGLAVLGVVHPEMGAVEALIGFSIALVAAENVWLLAGRGVAVPVLLVLGLLVLGIAGGRVPRTATAGLALFSACHFALLATSPHPARLRAAVAFAFGLVHGFGFAGVLATMSLPPERLATALFGFNLGVELGQLAVVAVAWPLLYHGARRLSEGFERLLAEGASAAIFGLGLFWLVVRSFGA